ncbi:MAG: TetR/AcrR family transcriptional regulator [Desulfarculaceae bacterium]|nr:TetR/AcrR family transcriptional regulator [Desulfarculaceae bacterium]MCF8071104.1 TetR/AcrR family transcriptional regulator [Desulfarculaceae bacterium]MCF8100692.1 TetR/AcrR family transcriptional regulator [Desulfarculaceae bacterium]MCF8118176.1 TetR/AcrR family transcriptional regulator [Desulfarculaceae bacterium]
MTDTPLNPVGTRRAQQKARTRELILEAAKELFETLGYGKTTIRAVAKFAGVGVGTVMSHFNDKASLLSEALVGDWELTREKARTTLPPGAGVRDQFLHVTRVFFEYYLRRPSLSRNLLKEVFFTPEVRSPWLRAQEEAMMTAGLEALRLAQEQGEIKPEVDCPVLLQAMFSNYVFVCLWGLGEPEPDVEELDRMLAKLIDLTLQGALVTPRG